jgi:phospho-N-acetylmuramoyl-pentapeptide-transferase
MSIDKAKRTQFYDAMILETDLYLKGAKMMIYFGLSFVVSMIIAPIIINKLKEYKFWKKKSRDVDMSGNKLEVTAQFYSEDEAKVKVPRAGGIVIWLTTLSIAAFFFVILKLFPSSCTSGICDQSLSQYMNFVDSKQTFIPIGVLVFGAAIGLLDDYLATRPSGGNYLAGGLKLSQRMIGVTLVAFLVGLWFHLRIGDTMHRLTLPFWNNDTSSWSVLDLSKIQLPFGWLDSIGQSIFGWSFNLANGGWLIIPLTVFVLLLLYAGSVIDGFDGLSAGTLIPSYLALAGLAFVTQYYQTATLLSVISGALVGYLWYNIPPARYYMGDTGITPMVLVLGVVVMLIDKLFTLPILAFLLIATALSVIVQVFSKKYFKRKVLLAAPLHHHLEAIGWTKVQVSMRYMLISLLCSVMAIAMGIIISK